MEQSKNTFGNCNILGLKKKTKEVLKGEIEACSKQEDWRTDLTGPDIQLVKERTQKMGRGNYEKHTT